jgi:hypothetical protein
VKPFEGSKYHANLLSSQFGTWIGDASVAKLSDPDGYWMNLLTVAKTDD